MNKPNERIKGIIFDIDGTLIIDGQAIPGAAETLSTLRKTGFSLRFITNTTGRSSEQLALFMAELGFEIESAEIYTSVSTCMHYLSTHFADGAGFLAIPDTIAAMFNPVRQTRTRPDFVVLGDLDAAFHYRKTLTGNISMCHQLNGVEKK